MKVHPLKAFRDRQSPKMGQAELGELLGVSRMTIIRWESGKRKPRPDQLQQISEKTGIPARELRPDLAEMMGSAA